MSGHIRRRGKASWELKYELPADPVTGKRRSKYESFKGTKKEASKRLNQLLYERDNGTYIEPNKVTVGEFLNQYLLDHAQNTVGAKTFERYSEIVEKHLSPALGTLNLKQLSPLHIQNYMSEAMKSGRRNGKGGLSAQTVKHHYRVLHAALEKAIKWRLIPVNPARAVDAPKPEHKEMVILTKMELATLLKAIQSSKYHMLIFLTAYTGLRRGEVCALRWSDINLENCVLTVNQSLERTKEGGLRFKEPKTKRGHRNITLPKTIVQSLRKHRLEQDQERLKLGLGRDNKSLVFANPDGSAIDPRNVTCRFKEIVKGLDITKISFHGLRHTHISHMLMDGVHVKVVSERAGHSAISVTYDKYCHVIPNMQQDAAVLLDQSIKDSLV